MKKIIFLVLFLLICVTNIGADIIHFKDGRSQEGEIVAETDETIAVKQSFGEDSFVTSTYKKSDIKQIQKLSEAEKASVGSYAFAKEQLIGEWDDEVGSYWKCNIKIIEDNNKFYMKNSFSDESSVKQKLLEVKSRKGQRRAFKNNENHPDEMYVINTQGDLEMYDSDGFIRKAPKVD